MSLSPDTVSLRTVRGKVLEDLPTVETIDLSGNRLTDESLMPLALKLDKIITLVTLQQYSLNCV